MRILVVAGSSGGHIFPAASFIDGLKNIDKGVESILVLPTKSAASVNLGIGYNINYIQSSNLSLSLSFRNIAGSVRFIKCILQSLAIVVKFKPDLVVGFGSLDSMPAVIIAWFLRINTLIHEQNVIPGKANLFLSKIADKVAVSFEESRKYFDINPDRVVLTGNPLRKELRRVDRKEALEFFGLDTDKFTFLVMGGSQGSRHINEVLAESLHKIPDPSAFQVIHICGNKDYNYLNNKYKDLPVRVRLIAFLDKMEYAYSASNLVFSRSGATTVAELDYYNIPSIFVPYPFAYAHQYRNAQVLERKGRAVIVKDEDLSVDKLLDLISDSIKRKPGAALEIKEGVHSRGAVDSLVNLAVSLI